MVAGVDALLREVCQKIPGNECRDKESLPDCWVLSTGDERERFCFLREALVKGHCIVFGDSYLKLLLDGIKFTGIIVIIDISDPMPVIKNELYRALVLFMRGRRIVYPDIRARLSPLEVWVLGLIMRGYTTGEIAFWTGRNQKHIHNCRRSIMNKVKAKSIQGLYARAVGMGFSYDGTPRILPGDADFLFSISPESVD